MRVLRVSAWVTFLPIGFIFISFAALIVYWASNFVWWISLPIAASLSALPGAAAYYSVSTTSNRKIAAMILVSAWTALEAYTLVAKGLTLPWHQNIIRLFIYVAVVSGAIFSAVRGGPRDTGRC
jgi:hypothetical protein